MSLSYGFVRKAQECRGGRYPGARSGCLCFAGGRAPSAAWLAAAPCTGLPAGCTVSFPSRPLPAGPHPADTVLEGYLKPGSIPEHQR